MDTWDKKSLKFPIDKSSHRNFMSSESFFPNPSCHVTPPGNFCWKIAEPPTWCYPNVWVGEGSSWDLSSLAKDCRVRSGSPVWQAGSPKMPTRCEELNDPTKVRGCSFLSRGVPRTWGSGFIIFRFSAEVQPVFVFGRVFWMALYWGWSMISPSLSQNAMGFFFRPLDASREKKKQRPFRSFLLGADRTLYQMLCFSQVFRSTVLPRPCRQNWIGWYQLADKLLFLQPQRYQCWVIHKDAWQRKTRIWWGLYTFRVWWPKKSEGCSKFIAGTWTKHGTPLNLWDYLGASCRKNNEKSVYL